MLELLNDEEIMKEYVLKKIIRYNHRARLQDESVAEHTCFVSLFCLKIMAKLELSSEVQRKVLVVATLHDAAECMTSDIPHDVKARYPEIEKVLEKIEGDYYKENWERYVNDMSYHSDEDLLVLSIVKLADAYSVYQWCLNERSLGNDTEAIKDIYEDAKQRIEFWTYQTNYHLEEKESRYARNAQKS